MVNRLSDLLDDAVRVTSSRTPVDLAGIVAEGGRRVRRRRRLTIASSTAAVVAAALLGVGLTGHGTSGTTAPASRPTSPVGPVLHPEDARPGVPGQDYRVWRW